MQLHSSNRYTASRGGIPRGIFPLARLAAIVYDGAMKNNKRPQAPKSRNVEYMRGMQDIRRSNAAGKHKSAADYRRKPKHSGRGWGDE